MRFTRASRNRQKMPAQCVSMYLDEKGREDLFRKWVDAGENYAKVVEVMERTNEKSQTAEELHGHKKERDILASFGSWAGFL
jgi:hypothetical protein